MSNDSTQNALHALLTVLQIEQRIRWGTKEEAGFAAVNETYRVVPYKQAFLFEWDKALPSLIKATAISGVQQPDNDSPLVRAYRELATHFQSPMPEEPLEIPSDHSGLTAAKAHEEFKGAGRIAVIPVNGRRGDRKGLLIIERTQSFTPGELSLLEKIADQLAASLNQSQSVIKTKVISFFKNKKKRRIFYAALILLFLFPMRASVLAPAEIVAVEPYVIRSPLQGVIDEVNVRPNQLVEAGATLFAFDREELAAQTEAARQGLAAATAELRQTSQMAMSDAEARTRIAALQGQMEKERADLAYSQSMLSRGDVKAPVKGVAVFENVYDWIGRNVSIGEKIMLLADPDKTMIEIRVPVTDMISLKKDGRVLFFSNAAPHSPNRAKTSFMGYRAAMDEQSVLSYRVEARWNEDHTPKDARLGVRGTAKLYGPWRPLIWQLFRKPLASLRHWVGI